MSDAAQSRMGDAMKAQIAITDSRSALPDLATARTLVSTVVTASGSSFRLGMRLVARQRRHAIHAVYAFCRVVDDIVDSTDSPEAKNAALDAWEAEVDAIYRGHPSCALSLTLHDAITRFDLPAAEFRRILGGMRMDANGPILAPSMAELESYSRCVAGAVGLLAIRIFGDDSEPARDFAIDLGDALQFTNILRDVAEDAGRGRLYLPAERLVDHGVPTHDAQAALAHPGLPAVCAGLDKIARQRFSAARTRLSQCDRRALRPAIAMMGGYQGVLNALSRRGWDAVATPPPRYRWARAWGAVGMLVTALR